MNRPQCGTYAGYQKHHRLGERRCEPCKAAAAGYQRTRRARNPEDSKQRARDAAAKFRSDPEKRRRELTRQRAQQRALWRLARAHHTEFMAFVEAELMAGDAAHLIESKVGV